MDKLFILLCWLGLMAMPVRMYAQTPDSSSNEEPRLVYIELKDGSSFSGTIVRQEDKQFILHTESAGDIVVRFDQIERMADLKEEGRNVQVNGHEWFRNTHPTRYFFSTNAIPMEKGRGYYQNTWIFLNGIHYGLTNHFSLGIGFETISTLLGRPIFYVAPKLSFPVGNKWHMGGGVLIFGAAISGAGVVGLGYGQVTYGTRDRNLSGGVGYGMVDGEFASRPFINIAGSYRVRKNLTLLSDNWLIPVDGYYGIYSYGARLMSEKIAVDLGLWVNNDIAYVFPIGFPWASIILSFGK